MYSISVSGTADNTLGSTHPLTGGGVQAGITTTQVFNVAVGASASFSASFTQNHDYVQTAQAFAPEAVTGTFSGSVSVDHPYAISVVKNGVALATMQPGESCTDVPFDISNHLDKLEAKHA